MNSFSQPHPAPVPARLKIVIADGGFADLAAARRLRPVPAGVTPPGRGTGNIFQPPPYGPHREVPGGC